MNDHLWDIIKFDKFSLYDLVYLSKLKRESRYRGVIDR